MTLTMNALDIVAEELASESCGPSTPGYNRKSESQPFSNHNGELFERTPTQVINIDYLCVHINIIKIGVWKVGNPSLW